MKEEYEIQLEFPERHGGVGGVGGGGVGHQKPSVAERMCIFWSNT